MTSRTVATASRRSSGSAAMYSSGVAAVLVAMAVRIPGAVVLAWVA